VVQARGLAFRAVAVLGLAEGEFPARVREDPFVWDADRARLREQFRLPLEPSTASAEAEFFYETVTRPRERLLLTRPRLADNGAPWQPSPFWEAVRRAIDVAPATLSSGSLPAPGETASWSELMQCLASHPEDARLRAWVAQARPERHTALETASALLHLRAHPAYEEANLGDRRGRSSYNGDLTSPAESFARLLGPRQVWSASRLEAYRTCPFFFFVGRVLGLEPRDEPTPGLDARQLGNIYHHLLEAVYSHRGLEDASDPAALVGALEVVAPALLERAPREEGFRATAWWDQTRAEILEQVRRTLEALAELQGTFRPYRCEAPFGLEGQPALELQDGDDVLRLRGLIDRVDRDAAGRVRIIDYKTAGPWRYTNRAVREGEKLQLPLYALAARDALRLGQPDQGFYWHVRQAKASPFGLEKFGPEEAMGAAVAHAWEAVRSARRGYFVPQPPSHGCPSYCPAAGFCWQYTPTHGA
jgi:ATP-dependent helicase/DNAse subunit B